MRQKKNLVLGLAAMTAALIAVSAARTEEGIYIPLMSYRTGPYSGAGAAIFNGMSDYLASSMNVMAGSGALALSLRNVRPDTTPKKAWSVTTQQKARILS